MRLTFCLQRPLTLPNKRGIAATRKHGAATLRQERQDLAWEIAAALSGVRPAKPIKYARVQVFRHSVGTPDRDNLFAACKALLDVLQPSTARRLYGLGIIENDCPSRCELRVFDIKAPRRNEQFTRVMITEIDATAIAAARQPDPIPEEIMALPRPAVPDNKPPLDVCHGGMTQKCT